MNKRNHFIEFTLPVNLNGRDFIKHIYEWKLNFFFLQNLVRSPPRPLKDRKKSKKIKEYPAMKVEEKDSDN